MGICVGIPILIAAAILNAAVMPEFRLAGGAPDIVFMVVVSWALLADVREALVWAVIGGVLQDGFSVAPLGTSALGLVIVAFAADSIFGSIQRGNLIVPPLVAVGGTVIYHLVLLVMLQTVGYSFPTARGLLYVTLPTVIYNTILILPVFRAEKCERFG